MRQRQAIVVDRPREEVFSFLADPRNLPAWVDAIETVELVEDDPPREVSVREGTRFAQHVEDEAEDAPARFEGRIATLAPPREVAFVFEGEAGRLATRFTVEQAASGTRVTEELDLPLTRMSTKLLAPFLWFANRSRLKRHLDRLKQTLEHGTTPSVTR